MYTVKSSGLEGLRFCGVSGRGFSVIVTGLFGLAARQLKTEKCLEFRVQRVSGFRVIIPQRL